MREEELLSSEDRVKARPIQSKSEILQMTTAVYRIVNYVTRYSVTTEYIPAIPYLRSLLRGRANQSGGGSIRCIPSIGCKPG